MDVRCDRCDTEYELDDAIVTDTGASVQCTSCGYTFIVTRSPSSPLFHVAVTPPGGNSGTDDLGAPEKPEWTLSTEEGKVHRFRDLSTLHKWIVERKVTRADRLSRAGSAWTALGDLPELVAFFDVVDQADRARGDAAPPAQPSRGAPAGTAAHGAPGRRPLTPAIGSSSRLAPARPAVASDGPTVPNRQITPAPVPRGPAASAAAPQRAPSRRPTPPPVPLDAVTPPPVATRPAARTEIVFAAGEADELDAAMLRPRSSAKLVVLGAGIVAAVAAIGYGLFFHESRPPAATASATTSSAPAPAPPAAAPTAAPAAPTAAVPAAPAATAEPEAPPAAPAPEPPPAPPAPPPAAAATSAPARTASSAPSASASRAAAAAAAGDAPGGRGASYEKLVSEGDRLLERGQTAKADRLYGQALVIRPDGVAALTGTAYVLLDHQRHLRAVETFRHALELQPSYGPALFGIAESYRARGDAGKALEAYRQYLAASPAGVDAPAARRQIKDLEQSTASAQTTPKDE